MRTMLLEMEEHAQFPQSCKKCMCSYKIDLILNVFFYRSVTQARESSPLQRLQYLYIKI
jgi:hypothetical protein